MSLDVLIFGTLPDVFDLPCLDSSCSSNDFFAEILDASVSPSGGEWAISLSKDGGGQQNSFGEIT